MTKDGSLKFIARLARNRSRSASASRLQLRVAALLFVLMTIAAKSTASTITVTNTGDGIGSGCRLHEAITAVNNQSSYEGCSITGPYTPVITINIPSGTFSTWTEYAPAYPAELVGAGINSTILNSGAFMILLSQADSLTVRNLTVRRRSDQPNSVDGIVKMEGTLTLNQVRVTACNGVSVYISDATANITNSRIDANTFGGIRTHCSNVTVSNSIVSGIPGAAGSRPIIRACARARAAKPRPWS